MTTQRDVTSAWRTVESTRDELQAYAKPGAFFSDRTRYDELVEKLKEAIDQYVRVQTEWAKSVSRK